RQPGCDAPGRKRGWVVVAKFAKNLKNSPKVQLFLQSFQGEGYSASQGFFVAPVDQLFRDYLRARRERSPRAAAPPQRAPGDGQAPSAGWPLPLSCPKAGRSLHTSHVSTWKSLQAMQFDGVLPLAKRSTNQGQQEGERVA